MDQPSPPEEDSFIVETIMGSHAHVSVPRGTIPSGGHIRGIITGPHPHWSDAWKDWNERELHKLMKPQTNA